jgi:hypothetical protein
VAVTRQNLGEAFAAASSVGRAATVDEAIIGALEGTSFRPSDMSVLLLSARVEHVTHAIADQIEGQDGDQNG